jgi:hypothetical protein
LSIISKIGIGQLERKNKTYENDKYNKHPSGSRVGVVASGSGSIADNVIPGRDSVCQQSNNGYISTAISLAGGLLKYDGVSLSRAVVVCFDECR